MKKELFERNAETGVARIQSDQARRHFREVLNLAEHDGDHVWIKRYTTVAAVVVPWDWYAQASGLMAADAIGKKIQQIEGTP